MSDPATSETTPAILARLFRNPGALLGTTWLDSVAEGWTDSSLHSQVLSTGTLSVTKTKEIYGHFRRKTQMKGLPGPYWMPDPTDIVREEARRLKGPPFFLQAFPCKSTEGTVRCVISHECCVRSIFDYR